MKSAEELFRLCNAQEVDLREIDAYIAREALSSAEMIDALVRLLDEHRFEIDSFRHDHGRDPAPSELILNRLPQLVEIMLKRGLDPNTVFTENNGAFDERYSIMSYVKWIDNSPIQLQTMRVLLENGADPNLPIGEEGFFEALDADLVTDVTLFEIEGEDRAVFEKDFRLWLLLMAYGGRTKQPACPVTMKNGHTIEIFRESEKFSYRLEFVPGDWRLHIFYADTGEPVAEL